MSASDAKDALPDFSSLTRDDLIVLCRSLCAQIEELKTQVQALLGQTVERNNQSGPGDPPSFVKASIPQSKDKKPRAKRNQPFSRRLEKPTAFVQHVPECCPDCGRTLSGGWKHTTRQVIDIAPSPVIVTEHQTIARWCGICHKRVLPAVDLSKEVLGKHRVGLNLMAWIGTLNILGRVPIRSIQSLLKLMFEVHLSLGEIVEILHSLAGEGRDLQNRLIAEVRGSPFVHADESGWRESGQNGYVWSFNTPLIRYYVYNRSRSGQVAEDALGKDFGVCLDKPQILVSDFYGGYNRFLCRHQRCWVHYLRDLHKLQEDNPLDASVQDWIVAVRDVYDRARAYQDLCRVGDRLNCGHFDRKRKRKEFENKLRALALPYVKLKGRDPVTQTVLAQRVLDFLTELFTFVEFPDVPSENNSAERSVRPAVIIRKISGGTRSAKGSATKMTLMTLFGTWHLQGKNPLHEAHAMLATTST